MKTKCNQGVQQDIMLEDVDVSMELGGDTHTEEQQEDGQVDEQQEEEEQQQQEEEEEGEGAVVRDKLVPISPVTIPSQQEQHDVADNFFQDDSVF